MGKIQEEDRIKGRTQYEYFPSGPAPPHKKLSEIEPPTMPERKVSLASASVNQRPEWCQVLQSNFDFLNLCVDND